MERPMVYLTMFEIFLLRVHVYYLVPRKPGKQPKDQKKQPNWLYMLLKIYTTLNSLYDDGQTFENQTIYVDQ